MIRWQYQKFDELNSDQLYEILALRQSVFIEEQGIHQVDADGKDQQAIHIIGKIENTLIAYARLLFFESTVRFGRVLVVSNYRRQGIATQLIQQILNYIDDNHIESNRIEISAQAHLIPFYQQFGFLTQGKIYQEANISHIKMIKTISRI